MQHNMILAGLRLLQNNILTCGDGVYNILIDGLTRKDFKKTTSPEPAGKEIDQLAQLLNTELFFTTQEPKKSDKIYRDFARDNYGTDEVQVDEDAVFSDAEEGVWVEAWLWVVKEEALNA